MEEMSNQREELDGENWRVREGCERERERRDVCERRAEICARASVGRFVRDMDEGEVGMRTV